MEPEINNFQQVSEFAYMGAMFKCSVAMLPFEYLSCDLFRYFTYLQNKNWTKQLFELILQKQKSLLVGIIVQTELTEILRRKQNIPYKMVL